MKLAFVNKILTYFLHVCMIPVVLTNCKDKTQNHVGTIFKQMYLTGTWLSYEINMGLTMCIDTCATLGGCSHVNFDTEKLFCALMMNSDNLTVSGLMEDRVSSPKNILVVINNATVVCGTTICKEGYSCKETTGARKICVRADKQCWEDKYLVTGPYGVSSDRVTFSSVANINDYMDMLFMLDSHGAWVAELKNTNQWIQVTFRLFKKVSGVVTQGKPNVDQAQWVSSYYVKYLVPGDTWFYVKDTSGSNKIFPRNTDINTKAVNYFTRSIITKGIQLRPQTWNGNRIALRFDLLGC